jgi:hypothetical protein
MLSGVVGGGSHPCSVRICLVTSTLGIDLQQVQYQPDGTMQDNTSMV